jgi:hypothetical protein
LLELLLIEKRTVQPYYVIDADRRSTGLELHRRTIVKKLAIERDPTVKDRLLPTSFHELHDVKPNPEITEHFKAILATRHLGGQHHWLALFADQQKIERLELCNHKPDPAVRIVEPYAVESRDEFGTHYELPEDMEDRTVYELFKYFKFPIMKMFKPDIEKKAREYDFIDILKHTWFCHRPLGRPLKNRPCGTCNTCIYSMRTGMGWRIPFTSKIRYYIHKVTLEPIKKRKGWTSPQH